MANLRHVIDGFGWHVSTQAHWRTLCKPRVKISGQYHRNAPSCISRLVYPWIKKPSMDQDVPSSYRPISYVSYISGVLKRVVDKRLTNHANEFNVFPLHQSTYRAHHSTETAVLSVHNALVRSADRGSVSMLGFFVSARHLTPSTIAFCYQSLTHGSLSTALRWAGFARTCQVLLFTVTSKLMTIPLTAAYAPRQCWGRWSLLHMQRMGLTDTIQQHEYIHEVLRTIFLILRTGSKNWEL